MRKTLSILAVLCVGLAAVGSAQAADYTWNTTSSGDWTNAANWGNGSAAPTDGDTAWILPVAGQTANYTVGSAPATIGYNADINMVIGGTSGTAKQILTLDNFNLAGNGIWLGNVTIKPTGVVNLSPNGWWTLNVDTGKLIDNQGTWMMTPRAAGFGFEMLTGASATFQNSGTILIAGGYDATAGTTVGPKAIMETYHGNLNFVNVGSGSIDVGPNARFTPKYSGYVPANVRAGGGGTMTLPVVGQLTTFSGTINVHGVGAVLSNYPDGPQNNPCVVVLSSGGYQSFGANGNMGDSDWFARNWRTIVKAGGTFEDTGGPLYNALRSQNMVIEAGGTWKNHRQSFFEGDVTNNAGGTIICGGAYSMSDIGGKGSGIRVGNDSAAGATFTNNGYWEIQNSPSAGVAANYGLNPSPYVGTRFNGTIINNGLLNITALTTTINFGDNGKSDGIGSLNYINNGTINRVESTAGFNLMATGFANNGTINWTGTMQAVPFGQMGSPLGGTNFAAGNVAFTNAATGTFNASASAAIGSTGGNDHLLFDNYGTLNLAGSTFGGTPTGNGTDYGYIRQSTAAAVTKGFGQVNVDFLATGIVNLNTANFGHLQGTLKATGGTMVVSNLAGTTGVANNAQTLIVDATGKLAADNGVLAVQGMEADVQVNGTLSLVNGGSAVVSGAGLSFAPGAVAEYGLKSKAATTTLLSVDGALALAGSVSVIDEGGIQAGKYLLATAGGAITGTMTTPNLIGGKHSVLDTATAGKVYLDLFNGGDANGDGKVDVLDLGILATNWQKTGVSWAQADFNGDGKVDVLDLGILATNWQATSGSFADAAAQAGLIVPEPATLALLGLGAAALIRRRKNA